MRCYMLLYAAMHRYTLLYATIRCYTLLYTAVHRYTPQKITLHRFTLLYAAIHRCTVLYAYTLLYAAVRWYTPLYTIKQRYTLLYAAVHHYTVLHAVNSIVKASGTCRRKEQIFLSDPAQWGHRKPANSPKIVIGVSNRKLWSGKKFFEARKNCFESTWTGKPHRSSLAMLNECHIAPDGCAMERSPAESVTGVADIDTRPRKKFFEAQKKVF